MKETFVRRMHKRVISSIAKFESIDMPKMNYLFQNFHTRKDHNYLQISSLDKSADTQHLR